MLLAVLLLLLVVVKRKYERLKRIFKDEGLNIDLQTTAGGDKTMTALLSGGIDIARRF